MDPDAILGQLYGIETELVYLTSVLLPEIIHARAIHALALVRDLKYDFIEEVEQRDAMMTSQMDDTPPGMPAIIWLERREEGEPPQMQAVTL